jgi:hypothetical protein
MAGRVDSPNRCERKLQEWQLLLLRLAITRDPLDRVAVLAIADELDCLGELSWRPAAPSFFRRQSEQVCDAIVANRNAAHSTVLRTHIARIDDPRLRRAFRAALGLTTRSQQEAKGRRRKLLDLWAGLPRR